jgi:antitoxin Xre/MbcA/ParS-like protein
VVAEIQPRLELTRPAGTRTGHARRHWHWVQEWSNVGHSSIAGLEAMFQPRTAGPADFDSQELGSTALTAFFNITAAWGLSAEEERTLLGTPPRSTFFKWKSERAARLSSDTLERISYVMGIYKALRILLPTQDSANAWIKKPNTAHGFGGRSALERMLAGRVIDLADVRRYLDAERG